MNRPHATTITNHTAMPRVQKTDLLNNQSMNMTKKTLGDSGVRLMTLTKLLKPGVAAGLIGRVAPGAGLIEPLVIPEPVSRTVRGPPLVLCRYQKLSV